MKLVGERRALSAVTFVFYAAIYLLLATMGPPEFNRAFFALAGVYGVAFFALVAGYFWARWYAVGVGLYGIITAAVGMWQIGPEPILLFLGGTHLAAVLMLWGTSMSSTYDGQTGWRQKFHMDDSAVQRLGRSVIRAGVSLPFVLLYALAPKPGGATIAAFGAVVLATLGIRGLIRLKTWGVLAIGAAGAVMLGLAGMELAGSYELLALKPALAGSLLVFAAVPWMTPMRSWITRTV